MTGGVEQIWIEPRICVLLLKCTLFGHTHTAADMHSRWTHTHTHKLLQAALLNMQPRDNFCCVMLSSLWQSQLL